MPGQDRRHPDAGLRRRRRRAPSAPRAAGAGEGFRARCAARPPRRASAPRRRRRPRRVDAASTRTSRSRTIIGLRVIRLNGFDGVAERLEAAAGQPVAALGRLVRVGGRADRDGLAAATTAARARVRSTSATFDLHPDRAPVAVVGRPVGPQLEGAHVAERAAVGAAHVRVQRPAEAHPLDAVQRAPAGLFAILDPHPRHDRTYVRTSRGRPTASSGSPTRCR